MTARTRYWCDACGEEQSKADSLTPVMIEQTVKAEPLSGYDARTRLVDYMARYGGLLDSPLRSHTAKLGEACSSCIARIRALFGKAPIDIDPAVVERILTQLEEARL